MSNENSENLADEWAAALGEQVGDDAANVDDIMADMAAQDAELEDAAAVELDELQDQSVPPEAGSGDPKLDVILDIPVTMTMEVGQTEIPIRNLLKLNQGSVVELDRVAGEPLDVRVNGTLIAHGEVVVVNDRYGIRLTDVISPQERIKRLK